MAPEQIMFNTTGRICNHIMINHTAKYLHQIMIGNMPKYLHQNRYMVTTKILAPDVIGFYTNVFPWFSCWRFSKKYHLFVLDTTQLDIKLKLLSHTVNVSIRWWFATRQNIGTITDNWPHSKYWHQNRWKNMIIGNISK